MTDPRVDEVATRTGAPDGPVIPVRPAVRRPVPVTILAAIQAIIAASYLGLVLWLILDPSAANAFVRDGGILRPRLLADDQLEYMVILGATGLLQAIAAIALLGLRRFGWTLTMLLAGVSLAAQIVAFVNSGGLIAGSMLLNVVTVLYLNQWQVRAAFGLAEDGGRDAMEDVRG